MATDQLYAATGEEATELPEESSKPSFIKKVKAKAKKLKSKLKPGSNEELASPNTQSEDLDDDQDDFASSDDEDDEHLGDIPYTLNDAAYQQHSGNAAQKKSSGGAVNLTEGYADRNNATNVDESLPSTFKDEGPAGVEQAVPTSYNYFYADPAQANLPSDHDTSKLEKDGESIQSAPRSTSRSKDESQTQFSSPGLTPHNSVMDDGGEFSASVDRNISPSIRQEKSSKQTDLSTSEVPAAADEPFHLQTCEGVAAGAAAAAAGAGGVAAAVGEGVGLHKSPAENARSANGSVNTTSSESAADGQTWTGKAYDAVVGTKDTVAAQLSRSTSNPERKFTDGSSLANSPASPSQTTSTEKRASGLKNTIASNANYADESLSSDSTPLTQKVTDTAYQAKDRAVSTLTTDDEQEKPITEKIAASAGGLKEAAVSKLDTSDKPISSDSTTVQQNVTDSTYQLKDSVASDVGYADQAMSTDSVPVSQKAADFAFQVKDYASKQLGYADTALSNDDKPISQKTSEAVYQGKDGVVQNTTPVHEDKTLANSVTETISTLPGLLSSKLGLGGVSSPTNTTSPTSNVADSTPPALEKSDSFGRKDTPHPNSGIFDRMSDMASSLFSTGAKKPVGEE